MSPEDWKPSWGDEPIWRAQPEPDINWAVARLAKLIDEDVAKSCDDVTITSVCDAMEIQMMGIKP